MPSRLLRACGKVGAGDREVASPFPVAVQASSDVEQFLNWWETVPRQLVGDQHDHPPVLVARGSGRGVPGHPEGVPGLGDVRGRSPSASASRSVLRLAFMKMAKTRWLRWPATLYVDVVRGTPLFLQILLVFFGLPLLPFYRRSSTRTRG